MSSITDHTRFYAEIASRNFREMFGIDTLAVTEAEETRSVETDKTFLVSLYYTGTVYGEYLLAMDEETAARIVGCEHEINEENRSEVRDEICDAISETLNTIVGESIVDLQKSYAKLTVTAPRVYFGQVRYPQFRTGRTVIKVDAGEIECHFCLDMMRLDLATSYSEAMDSLVEINNQLKEANRHLAQQQAQLVHTEKMASVGILASGVAHEINNPLFFVDANLSTLTEYVKVIDSTLLLYDKLCESISTKNMGCDQELASLRAETQEQDLGFVIEDTKQLVDETREGVERIKGIVQGLKDFSQVEGGGFAEADLSTVAENALGLIASQLPSNCHVEKQLEALPPIVCNAGEIGQAIAGVLLNAGQAISEGGTILLQTKTSDSTVMITVKDDGVGIASEHIDHLFEPFFTTKQVGEGTGLGLSIAYGIFEKHEGSITVESDFGKGTCVTMRLPLASHPAGC